MGMTVVHRDSAKTAGSHSRQASSMDGGRRVASCPGSAGMARSRDEAAITAPRTGSSSRPGNLHHQASAASASKTDNVSGVSLNDGEIPEERPRSRRVCSLLPSILLGYS